MWIRSRHSLPATRQDGKINAIRPRPAWIPYFEELLASRLSRERETSVGLTQDHEWSGIRLVLSEGA